MFADLCYYLIRPRDKHSLARYKKYCGECRFNWFEKNVSLLSLSSTFCRARNQRKFKLTEAQSSRKAVTTDKSITKINSSSAKSLILHSGILNRSEPIQSVRAFLGFFKTLQNVSQYFKTFTTFIILLHKGTIKLNTVITF